MKNGRSGEIGQPNTAGRVMSLMVELALEKGLDALSMRDVAKRAGISLAALQYHYPSKDTLIAAFVESILDGFRKDIRELRGEADPVKALKDMIFYAIDRTLDERVGDIFAMLEARARHDKATASALDSFMRSYLEIARDVLLRRHSNLTEGDATRAAVRLVATIEGLSSVVSAARAKDLSVEHLRDIVMSVAEETNIAQTSVY